MDEDTASLFKAAYSNDIPVVQSLLEKSIDLNYIMPNGFNAINMAVSSNHKEMVKFLLKHGAILNNPETKSPPLIVAIHHNHEDMVEVLVDLGADVNVGWNNGVKIPPLLFATNRLNYRIVKILLMKGANVSAAQALTKATALQEAAGRFTGRIFRDEPYTATVTVRVKIAKLLLCHGANLASEDVFDMTALDHALGHSVELSKLLIIEGAAVRRPSGREPGRCVEALMSAVNLNSPELVRLCLERGGDYCFRAIADDPFSTPYHRALVTSTPQVVKVFWEFGCPIDLGVGMNPSQEREAILVGRGNMSVYEAQALLVEGIRWYDLNKILAGIKQGAVPRGTSRSVQYPLHHSASTRGMEQSYKIARVLLEHGVPVNALHHLLKKTCLFLAISNCDLNTTKELLKFGVCIRLTEFELGLLKSMGLKNKEMCQIMGKVTSTFKLTRQGSTKVLKRINRYIKSGNTDMAKMMMNCVDRRGRTLMGLALEKGHTKLAEELMKIRVKHL